MTVLNFRQRRPIPRVIYVSVEPNDTAAIAKAKSHADEIGAEAIITEPPNQWNELRKLLRQDARGLISLEFVIFEKGTHPIKELLFRKYGRIDDDPAI